MTTDLWEELGRRIADSAASSYSRIVQKYREEAKALESRKLVIGWNYCRFFVVKEGLAFMYLKAATRRMTILALHVYRELYDQYQALEGMQRICSARVKAVATPYRR
jgi:hypothetical protein